jgi:hypothetical protein
MAVAVITDIHGNLPALEAALARTDELGIERICCGGDLVGYGPHPNEVCALVAERKIPTIYGNYDYAIARDLDDCGCAYIDQHDRDLGQQSIAWTLIRARDGRAARRAEGHRRGAHRGRPGRGERAAEPGCGPITDSGPADPRGFAQHREADARTRTGDPFITSRRGWRAVGPV